jgi:hypothetical protein
MTDDQRPSATLDDVLAAVERTSYGELLHDDQRRRHELYELMAVSDDPLVREMGQQLRDGLLRPRDLLSDPDYADGLIRGCQRLGELAVDLDDVVTQIDELGRRERDERGEPD